MHRGCVVCNSTWKVHTSTSSARSDLKREMELQSSRSWTDCLAAELFLNSCFSAWKVGFWLCSEQPLKEQVAEYAGCYLFNRHCSRGGWRSLRSLRIGAYKGRDIHRYPNPPSPPPPPPRLSFLIRFWGMGRCAPPPPYFHYTPLPPRPPFLINF